MPAIFQSNAYLDLNTKYIFENRKLSSLKILILTYLGLHASMSGKVIINPEFIAEELGYTSDNADDIILSLSELEKDEYIKLGKGNVILQNLTLGCRININKDIFNKSINDDTKIFSICRITESELYTVVKNHVFCTEELLILLIYIKGRIDISSDKINRHYCYDDINSITYYTKINKDEQSIRKIIRELFEMGLVFQYVTGYPYKDTQRFFYFYTTEKFKNYSIECDDIAKAQIDKLL